MSRFMKSRAKKIGLSPGTLMHFGEKKVEKIRIRLIDYDPETVQEQEFSNIEECFASRDSSTISWIDIEGLHDVSILEKFAQYFGIHALVLEDILTVSQRPKLEVFDDYLFLVLKMLQYDTAKNELSMEQVSFIIGTNYVVSFQERPGDVFDPVRNRIRGGKGRIRKMGSDYLVYALADAIVDNYFLVLEAVGDRLEELDEQVVTGPTPQTLSAIHHLKRELIFLRKAVWPLREVISMLAREESPLLHSETRVFIRDLYDHTVQVIETMETFRDMVGGLLDVYLSSVSNKMNEVMKVLTIIATIFIPLTFIAGIYGMNFDYMPELKWRYGYFATWGAMLLIFAYMMYYFKRKGWL